MYKFFKRLFDIVSAILLFIILLPLFFILIILVRINLGSPVFFKQERTGMHEKSFKIIKFRTMTDAKDQYGNYLPDEHRVTKFGKFLRSTSLDELPELFCIINGSMSVIGPRPLPPMYDTYYTESEKARFKVRSGLIPPDVARSQAVITWDDQFECEVEYAMNLSFLIDVKVFLSVFKVMKERSTTDYGSYVRQPLNMERNDKAAYTNLVELYYDLYK